MSDEGRYSKVSRRMWNDEKFRRLSPPKPNGQSLFQRLLTGPELGCIPGLFQAWDAGLAQALGWPMRGFSRALSEILREGLARRDQKTGLFFLPNAIFHNEPTSPNVIRSWATAWRELPECDLKSDAEEHFRQFFSEKGLAWEKAFEEATAKPSSESSRKPSAKPSGKPSAKAPPHPLPNQEQEQEQEQDHPKAADSKPRPQEPTRGQQQRPTNLDQALKLPIMVRAQAILDHPELQTFTEPHRWPELQRFGKAIAKAAKWHEPRWTSATSKAVMPLVRLLAEFTTDDLRKFIDAIPDDKWLRDQGFSTLTDEVVRRALKRGSSRSTPRRSQADIDAELKAREEADEAHRQSLLAKAGGAAPSNVDPVGLLQGVR